MDQRWHSDVYQLCHLLESSLLGACLLCEPSWTLLPSPRWTDQSARLSMTICCTRWADWSKFLLPEPSWTFLPSPRWTYLIWHLLAGWRCYNLGWHSDVYQLHHLLKSSRHGACLFCEPSWTLLPSPRWEAVLTRVALDSRLDRLGATRKYVFEGHKRHPIAPLD